MGVHMCIIVYTKVHAHLNSICAGTYTYLYIQRKILCSASMCAVLEERRAKFSAA